MIKNGEKFAWFCHRRCKTKTTPACVRTKNKQPDKNRIMKSFNQVCRAAICGLAFASLIAIPSISRADGTNSPVPVKPTPYPLDHCIVSGEKFGGDMGPPIVFVYSNKDVNQEIKFCCPMCKPKFLADSDKYMKIIHDAEAKTKN